MGSSETRKRPRSQVIASRLRERILQGEYEVGTRLLQDVLAADFGVSHIPVREALRELAAEGLVTIRPQLGAIVAGISPESVAELLEVRALLELKAVRWAMPNVTETLLDHAENILREAEQETETGNWMDCNWRFHRSIYDCAQRPWLSETIQALNVRVERSVRLLLSTSHYRQQAEAEHRAILAAVRVRNIDAACSLLNQHLFETAHALTRMLAEFQPENNKNPS
jgi:DNA-binding GntR family transcriptional regulator